MMTNTQKSFYYSQVEHCILFDKTLGHTARDVYEALLRFMNRVTKQCTVYIKTLAEILSCSVSKIFRGLKTLCEKGIIIRASNFDKTGHKTASTFQIIGINAPCYNQETQQLEKFDNDCSHEKGILAKTTCTHRKNDTFINKNNINKNNINKNNNTFLFHKKGQPELPKFQVNKILDNPEHTNELKKTPEQEIILEPHTEDVAVKSEFDAGNQLKQENKQEPETNAKNEVTSNQDKYTPKDAPEELSYLSNNDFVVPMVSRLLERGEWVVIENANDYRIIKNNRKYEVSENDK